MSGDIVRPSSREVEHEAEDTRAHLASTLEQLRTNLRPENVVDEVVSNAKVGAATVVDNLLGIARANPVPSLLIAAGAALVMGVASRGKPSPAARDSVVPSHLPKATPMDDLPDVATLYEPEAAQRAAARPASLRDDLRTYVADQRSRLSASVEDLKRQAADVYDTTATGAHDAVRHVSRYIPQDRAEAKSKLSNLLDEQPLILGAIGLAIGAAIGAALPTTDTEDHLLGGTSHHIRQAASDVARYEVEGLKAVAGETVENVRKSAVDHGLSTENLNDLVKDVGAHARAAVDKVGSPHDA